jgi:hypothetical protein
LAETATAVAGISAEHGDAPFYLFRRVNGHMHLPTLQPPSNGMSPSRVSVPTIMMRP